MGGKFDDGSNKRARMRPEVALAIGGGPPEVRGIPRIEITEGAFRKLLAYIAAFPQEISGFGRIHEVSSGVFRVTDVFLVEQDEVSGAHVTVTEGFAKFLVGEVAADRPIADIRFWWHSHVHFEAFWSATDDGTARAFGMDWLVSFVGNKRGEFRVRLDVYQPLPLTFDDLPLSVILEPNADIHLEAAEDIRKCVKRVRLAPTTVRRGRGPMHRIVEGVVRAFGAGGPDDEEGAADVDDAKDVAVPATYRDGWVRQSGPGGAYVRKDDTIVVPVRGPEDTAGAALAEAGAASASSATAAADSALAAPAGNGWVAPSGAPETITDAVRAAAEESGQPDAGTAAAPGTTVEEPKAKV